VYNMAELHGDVKLSDLDYKIIRQIEYYFGDINLPKDRFLQEKIRENDGWVSLDVMLNFNRLKDLSQDKEAISSALRQASSGLIEVSEDSTKIRRCPARPLPDNTKERKDDLLSRTYYVKPFPLDITLDALTEFFEKFGKVESVQMRRAGKPEREFKGSVFVVFADKVEGNKFLAMENVKYQSTDLTRMTKKGDQDKEETEKKLEDQITKGSILFIKGLSEDTSREDIKSFFGDFGNVAWVEFNKGDEKALLRIHDGQAKAVMDKSKEAGDGKIILNNTELEARVLEGEEELDYWRKMFREVADRKQQKKHHHSQNRKRKFGGRPQKQGKLKTGAFKQGNTV
ncbi:hypothetical protein BaRGS_00002461, partial [Batillaria attramentaria]